MAKNNRKRATYGSGTAYEDKERGGYRVQLSTRDRHGNSTRKGGRGENPKQALEDAQRNLKAFAAEQERLAAQEAEEAQQQAGSHPSSQVLLADWVKDFLLEKAQTAKPTTVDNYTRMFDNHILPALGQSTLAELTARPELMRAFYLQLSRTPSGRKNEKGEPLNYSAETVRTARAALSSALTHAVEKNVIVSVPTVRLAVARDSERDLADATARPLADTDDDATQVIDAWSREEAEKFTAVALQDRWGVVLVFLLATGMRRGEALGLKWDQVDLGRSRVRVIRNLVKVGSGKFILDTPKSKASRRTLPLSSLAVACLQERQRQQTEDHAELGRKWQKTGLVFTQIKGTHMNGDNLRREMRRLARMAGVRAVTIHTLRDTYATLLRRRGKGVGIEVISKYLGHQDPALTLRRYRQVQPDELEQCTVDLFMDSMPGLPGDDEGAGAVVAK